MRLLWTLALGALIFGCGKKTPPVPYGSVELLPPVEEARIYLRGAEVVLDWPRPGADQAQQDQWGEQVEVYRIRLLQPERGCLTCRPERRGLIEVTPNGRLLPNEDLNLKNAQAKPLPQGRLRLIWPVEDMPPGDFLHLQLDYVSLKGATAPSGRSYPVRRPGPIPRPQLELAQWGPASCGEACPQLSELHLRWRRDLARRVEVLDPAGGHYEREEHYRLRLFYLDEDGAELPAHDLPLLTDHVRLELERRPLLARQEDRFGNLGPAAMIDP